jgi:hypothetical protein
MADEPHFTHNPLVEALVPDAGDPPVLTYLEGYLGRSSRTHYVRLYESTTLTLKSWVDVPVSRVRYTTYSEPEPGEPAGIDRLWLDGAKLTGDGLDPIYPGGELTLVDSDNLLAKLSATAGDDGNGGGEKGGGQPGGGARLAPPPFRRRH